MSSILRRSTLRRPVSNRFARRLLLLITLTALLGLSFVGLPSPAVKAGREAPASKSAIASLVINPTRASDCATSSFASALNYPTGSLPYYVAVGDFNGDGKPDLAVANYYSESVSVLLGNGGGTFQAKVDYGAGTHPISVAVGDFNGDGKPDLAVANESSASVSVLLGNGDGTFQPKVDYVSGSNSFPRPYSVAVGDFNGDGKSDLVVANEYTSNVSVLLGNGDGTFQAKVDYNTGSAPFSVAVGDFNGDGKPDLAVANYNWLNVSVLLGNGDGTFQPKVDYGTGARPVFVAVGDFNGDGKPDLAVVNGVSESYTPGLSISVLLGNGDGTFQPKVDYGTGDGPFSVAVGDFNGDGKPDLAVANESSGSISVLLGNGDGTFQPKVDYGAGTLPRWFPRSVAVGDFNGDSKPDLAVTTTANFGFNDVSILLNTSAWNTPPVAKCKNIQVSANSSCQASITAADLDDSSFDPDTGDSIASRTLDTSGPFGLGAHTVTLTVTDTHGASSECSTIVTVVDNTKPVISCPTNITMTASLGSTNAIVSYSAPTATDACGVPIVSCSKASGSSFPVGTTTVSCTATDSSNNSGECAFMVTVLTPQGAAQQFVDKVNSLVSQGVLSQGNGNALIAKLQAAISSMNSGNKTAACSQLQAFINQTKAFISTGKFTTAQGQPLINSANALMSVLGC